MAQSDTSACLTASKSPHVQVKSNIVFALLVKKGRKLTFVALCIATRRADFAALCCGRTSSIAVEKTSWRKGGKRSFATSRAKVTKVQKPDFPKF